MNTISFNSAIVIAISFFILSGVFSEFFGVKKASKHKRRYAVTVPISNPEAIEYTTAEADYLDKEPAKVSCKNCGNSLVKGDVFCSVCGEKGN